MDAVYVFEHDIGPNGKVFLEGKELKGPNRQSVEGIAERIYRTLGVKTIDRVHPYMERGIRKYRMTLERKLSYQEFQKVLRG